MRRLFSPFQIAVLTVALTITAAFVWLRFSTVELCEIIENPRRYDGKYLRVKAALFLSMHGGYYLADENCSENGDKSRAAISFYPANSSANFDTLNKLEKSEKLYNDPVKIVAMGRFTYKNNLGSADSIQDRTHLQFEIYQIESAEK